MRMTDDAIAGAFRLTLLGQGVLRTTNDLSMGPII
jgi:hypothetical protein